MRVSISPKPGRLVLLPSNVSAHGQLGKGISVGQAHADEQLSEARVVAEWFEPAAGHFEISKFGITLLIRLFQPSESLVPLTQGSMENRDRTGRHKPPAILLVQRGTDP